MKNLRNSIIIFFTAVSLIISSPGSASITLQDKKNPEIAAALVGVGALLGFFGYFIFGNSGGNDNTDDHSDEDNLKSSPLKVKQLSSIDSDRGVLQQTTNSVSSSEPIQYLEYELENTDDKVLDISKIDGFGDDGIIAIANDHGASCPKVLEPGGTCILKLAVKLVRDRRVSKELKIGNGDGDKIYFKTPIKFYIPSDLQLEIIADQDIDEMELGEAPLELEYTINNTGSDPIRDFRIAGYSEPIGRDSDIVNNCGDILESGDSCNIRLVVKPKESGTILQNLKVLKSIDSIERELNSVPIKIKVTPPEVKTLKFKFTKVPTNIKRPMKVIGTTKLGDREPLDYTLANIGTQVMRGIKIGGYSHPIERDKSIDKNCGSTLAPGTDCDIRLIANPTREGIFSQDLEVVVKDRVTGEEQKITSNIELESEYVRHMIITKDMVKIGALMLVSVDPKDFLDVKRMEDIFEENGVYKGLINHGNKLIFCDHTIDDNDDTKWEELVISDTDKEKYQILKELPFVENGEVVLKNGDPGLTEEVKKALDTSRNKFEREESESQFTTPIVINELDENAITRYIFLGTNDGLRVWSRYRNNLGWAVIWRSVVEDLYISGANVHAASSTHSVITSSIAGYRWSDLRDKIDCKYFGIRSGGGKIFVTTDQGLRSINEKGHKFNYFDGPIGELSLRKIHIEGHNIYIASVWKLFISNDLGKTWNRYYKRDGLASNSVQVVHSDGTNIYAGTDDGLSISEDSGKSWRTTLADYHIYGVYGKDDEVWAVTKEELFISKDNGRSWIGEKRKLGDYAIVFFPVIKKYTGENEKVPPAKEYGEEDIKYEDSLGALDLMAAIKDKDPKDYRSILGLHKYEEDCAALRKAYRERSAKCHPDKINGVNNKQLASEVYAILAGAKKGLEDELECHYAQLKN